MRLSLFSNKTYINQQFFQDKVATVKNQLSLQDLPKNYKSNFDQEIKREIHFKVKLLDGKIHVVSSLADLAQIDIPEPIKYLLGKHLCQTPADETQGDAVLHQMQRAIFDYYFLNKKLLSGFSSSELVLQQADKNKFILKITGDCRVQEDPTPTISKPTEQSAHLTMQCYNLISQNLKPYILGATRFLAAAYKQMTACIKQQVKNGLQLTHEYLFEMKEGIAYGSPYQTTLTPCVYAEPSVAPILEEGCSSTIVCNLLI